ncbi:hypothetical protein [Bacillus sp. V5-8f]|uniref:hypothetical protein n=1 Tax=Bacillus sp. V5-8f TaxID=2053044 RepID=UPI0015E13479|nr:hypothetical protein [Bacillus sp. V5-8f]
MNFADWYAKREPRYKEWRSRWKSRVNMENTLLYVMPAIVMAIAPFTDMFS